MYRKVLCSMVSLGVMACSQTANVSPGLPAPADPATSAATVPAITAADLRQRLWIFADDSMLGRAAGTLGNMKATAYIEREVRALGLQPAGDNGTFFQSVPLVTRALAQSSSLSVDG